MARMPWSVAITVAAISIVVPIVFRWLGARRGAPPSGQLRYSNTFKRFALGLGFAPPAVVAIAVALQERPLRPDEGPAVVLLLVLFPAITGPLLVEFYGVMHTYD